MYQIVTDLLSNHRFNGKIRLIYANTHPNDTILLDELHLLSRQCPDKFSVTYLFETAVEDTLAMDKRILSGRITKDVLEQEISLLQQKQEDSVRPQIVVCGPDGMMRNVCGVKPIESQQGRVTGYLGDLGYSNASVVKL